MENLNLIRKITWAFHHTTGVEWDDLFQEASLAYLEAIDTFDESKGSISTYMWKCCSEHLKNYIKGLERQKCIMHNCTLHHINDSEEEMLYNNSDFNDKLTIEAKELAKVILSAPKIFSEVSPKEAKLRLAKTMLKKGWSWKKIWIGINDLKLACRQ